MQTRAERMAEQRRLTARLLERTGYTALKRQGLKAAGPAIPDYRVEQRTAPVSNVIAVPGALARHELPEGAKQFPVGHLHKQGLSVITPGAIAQGELQYFGGKKA